MIELIIVFYLIGIIITFLIMGMICCEICPEIDMPDKVAVAFIVLWPFTVLFGLVWLGLQFIKFWFKNEN